MRPLIIEIDVWASNKFLTYGTFLSIFDALTTWLGVDTSNVLLRVSGHNSPPLLIDDDPITVSLVKDEELPLFLS